MNTELTDEGIDNFLITFTICSTISGVDTESPNEGIDTQNHITKRCKCLLM